MGCIPPGPGPLPDLRNTLYFILLRTWTSVLQRLSYYKMQEDISNLLMYSESETIFSKVQPVRATINNLGSRLLKRLVLEENNKETAKNESSKVQKQEIEGNTSFAQSMLTSPNTNNVNTATTTDTATSSPISEANQNNTISSSTAGEKASESSQNTKVAASSLTSSTIATSKTGTVSSAFSNVTSLTQTSGRAAILSPQPSSKEYQMRTVDFAQNSGAEYTAQNAFEEDNAVCASLAESEDILKVQGVNIFQRAANVWYHTSIDWQPPIKDSGIRSVIGENDADYWRCLMNELSLSTQSEDTAFKILAECSSFFFSVILKSMFATSARYRSNLLSELESIESKSKSTGLTFTIPSSKSLTKCTSIDDDIDSDSSSESDYSSKDLTPEEQTKAEEERKIRHEQRKKEREEFKVRIANLNATEREAEIKK